MQYIAAAFVAMALLGAALFGFNSPTSQSGGVEIVIGFIGPLTGDGAAWGEIELNSIRLAVDEINESGGVDGRTIKVVAEDGKCDGKVAASAAQKLIDVNKVKILLVSCSQEVLPIASIAEQKKVLVLASYAAASNISDAGDYVFRNSWTNRDMGRSLAEESRRAGATAAVITEHSEFATDLKNIFIEDYTGTLVADESFVQGEHDVRSQVTKILKTRPEVIVVNPIGPATGLAVLKQLKEQGYKGTVIGNFFGSSSEVQAAPEAKGMVYVADPSVANTREKQAFIAEYKTRFGAEPSLEWPAVARYDAVHILANAMRDVGDDPTRMKDWLYAMPAYTGLAGTYSFDTNGDAVGIKPTVAEIQ